MKVMLFKAALTFTIFCASPVFASIINYGGYSHNTDSDIVSGHSQEWLRWDVTNHQSVDDALASYGSSGWRLATDTEIGGLLNSFNFGFTFDNDDATSQQKHWNLSSTDPEYISAITFTSMFGYTSQSDTTPPQPDYDTSGGVLHAGYKEGTTNVSARFANGAYADLFIAWGIYNYGDGNTPIVPEYGVLTIDKLSMPSELFGGVALVRSSVPESNPFVILFFGLLTVFGLQNTLKRSR